ncbi:MAG TPA: hypothetical protein PKN24_16370, partial [bacterium]|nr:hypothetical protein [bacterium]
TMFVPKVEVFFILLLMQQKVCRNPIRPRAGIFDFAADAAKVCRNQSSLMIHKPRRTQRKRWSKNGSD